MPVRRISGAVAAYVVIAVAQLVAVLLIGGAGVSIPGVIVALCLFYFLAAGSPVAWWILVALNSVALVGLVVDLVAHLSGHLLWGNFAVLAVTTVAMEAALLSPAMRHHVASRGLRLAPRRSTARR